MKYLEKQTPFFQLRIKVLFRHFLCIKVHKWFRWRNVYSTKGKILILILFSELKTVGNPLKKLHSWPIYWQFRSFSYYNFCNKSVLVMLVLKIVKILHSKRLRIFKAISLYTNIGFTLDIFANKKQYCRDTGFSF